MPVTPAVRLFSALSVDGAWLDVIQPWLERATVTVKDCAVVLPTRGLAVALKLRALESSMNLLGVRFLLPADLRELLTGEVANRDALRLAATIGAEEIEAKASSAGERQIAGAIARSPDAFLQAFDQLDQAGWNPLEYLPPSLRRIAKSFVERIAEAGLPRLADLDRQLKVDSAPHPPLFSRLLIVGFDAAHWPQFRMLTAAARYAEETEVVLTEPRDQAREIDSLWIGSWEQEFSAVLPVAGKDRLRPMTEFLRLPESRSEIERRSTQPADCIDFLVAETAADLSNVIAMRVSQSLTDCESPRIAVVFPRASALSRLVSMRLATAGVLHNDSLGHPLADASEDPAWTAWLRLQDDRRVGPFVEFIEECSSVPQLSHIGSSAIAHRLRKELADLLIDDLPVLAASLGGRDGEPLAMSVAVGLRELIWLPERASVADMYSVTLRAFAQLGWQAKSVDLRWSVAAWIGKLRGSISRIFWLRWIADVLSFSERQRVLEGRHPYARVHLISLADAAPLEWTHVVLGGLNEGAWPLAPEEEGWLSEPEIMGLNVQARCLNKQAIAQGRHGEGHEAMRPERAWCLTSGDARSLLQRQFFNLMENASVCVTATTTMRSPEAPDRISTPGEFFSRLYFCTRGRAVSPAIMTALQSETQRWLTSAQLRPEAVADIHEVKETRNAWNVRRADGRPFGEYEFALKLPPAEPVSLAATKWESALRSPAHVFMDVFLNVSEPEEADPDFTARAVGTWVHRWLAKIGGGSRDGIFRPLPPGAELEEIVRGAARADRNRVEMLLGQCGRSVPDWWNAIWEDAFATALALVRKIPAGVEWTHCATEFRLGALSVDFPDGTALRVSGQIDLLLAQGVTNESNLPEGHVWIIDYKTGDPKPLNAGKLAGGDGLQLGLYGLAVRVLGAKDVSLSRVGRSLDLGGAQMGGKDLDALASLWNGLVAMQESGRFGMLGAVRSPYGIRAIYPLATLGIDEAILQSKWVETHTVLNGGGE